MSLKGGFDSNTGRYGKSLKGKACWRLSGNVRETRELSPEAIGWFIEGSEEVRSKSKSRKQVDGCVEQLLFQQEYAHQTRWRGAGYAVILRR